jgi:hypothetical protein
MPQPPQPFPQMPQMPQPQPQMPPPQMPQKPPQPQVDFAQMLMNNFGPRQQ